MTEKTIADVLEFAPRAEELATRLVAAGPKAAHVSASETHEIADFVHAAIALLSKLRAPVADERAAFHLARKVELLEQVAHYADLCCAFLRDAGYAGKADALTSRIKAVIDLDGQISPPLADERAAENHFEDELERAYWEMDARIKGLGKHKGRPQPDRDAFKWAVRGMRPTPPKPPKPVPERICICCNVPRNNCDCEPEAAALASAPVAGEAQNSNSRYAAKSSTCAAAPQASEAVRNAGIAASSDVTLPPLPKRYARIGEYELMDYARAAVLADRQQRGEVVDELARLREALEFYAHGNHYHFFSDTWDTCSGEPQNFWFDEAETAMIEDGSVARAALPPQPAAIRNPLIAEPSGNPGELAAQPGAQNDA